MTAPRTDVAGLLDELRSSAPHMPPIVAVAVIADLIDAVRAGLALADELDAATPVGVIRQDVADRLRAALTGPLTEPTTDKENDRG